MAATTTEKMGAGIVIEARTPGKLRAPANLEVSTIPIAMRHGALGRHLCGAVILVTERT